MVNKRETNIPTRIEKISAYLWELSMFMYLLFPDFRSTRIPKILCLPEYIL